MRTTIYLAGPAAEALEHVRTVYLEKYGIATTVSSVLARLLLGETIDEIVERPFRNDLKRIGNEADKLRHDLQRVRTRRRTDLHRIHREVADLFSRVRQISNTLGRVTRRKAPPSADFTEAARIENSLDKLMRACANAIVPRRKQPRA